VECDRAREAVSAALDGEPLGVPEAELSRHLRSCADCAAFAAAAGAAHRPMRLRVAGSVPDLTPQVVARVRAADRERVRWGLRAALAATAVAEAALALPELAGDGGGHGARHLGAFSVAVAIGLLLVVARPARARSFLALTATLAGALVIGAAVDLARGATPALGESRHLVEVTAFALVWLLAREAAAPPTGRARRPAEPPGVQAVEGGRTVPGRDGRRHATGAG
jgi:predicted anti-sigma-YlaC factor YlaD